MPWKTCSLNWYSRPCGESEWMAGSCGCRNRLHNIGVSVSDTRPDTRMAAVIVTANSWSRRPSTPPMNMSGMKTATSESVIDRMVNPISREPRKAASRTVRPSSV